MNNENINNSNKNINSTNSSINENVHFDVSGKSGNEAVGVGSPCDNALIENLKNTIQELTNELEKSKIKSEEVVELERYNQELLKVTKEIKHENKELTAEVTALQLKSSQTTLDEDKENIPKKKTKTTWTHEEDVIIIECYAEYPSKWRKEAMERLPGRDDIAIKNRWQRHLQEKIEKKNPSKKWTAEEDAILLREYKIDPKNYTAKVHTLLPHRTKIAIQSRFAHHLNDI